jgi:hypothetical protein
MKIEKAILFISFITATLLLFLIPAQTNALTLSPPRIELEGDPGTTITGKIKLINEQKEDKTFYSSFGNFEAKGETGTPSFVENGEDLAGWISTETKVSIKQGEEVIVPFSISIPKNAEPGGHFAGIFWGTIPPQNAQLSIGAKVTSLVLLRVSGDIKEGGGILEFDTKNKQKLFTSLPVEFYYRFQNTGDDRAKPIGEIKMKNILGFTSKKLDANISEGNVLPHSTRRFSVIWGDEEHLYPNEVDDGFIQKYWNGVKREWHNFALGRYSAKLNFIYGSQNTSVFAKTTLWVLPWHLLLLILIILLIVILLGRREVLKYNEWVVKNAMKHIKNAHETIKKIGNSNKPRI